MKNRKKAAAMVCLAAGLAVSAAFPALAEWKYDESVGKWWWQEFDGTYPKSSQEYAGTTLAASMLIDGNGDGAAEYYYFDENGYLYTDTVLKSPISDYTVSVNGDGAEYNGEGVLTEAVVPGELPAGAENSFLSQTYIKLLGKDRAYVESVLGTTDSEVSYSLGDVCYVYTGNVKVYFSAGKAQRMELPAGTLFQYEKDSYAYDEIASLLGIPAGYFGTSNYNSNELQWYMIDGDKKICVLFTEGGTESETDAGQDGIINRSDEVSAGLYWYGLQ